MALLNPDKSKVVLNPILSWYGGDWNGVGGYLAWLEKLVDDEDLKAGIAEARQKKIGVKFYDYDWSLNSQAKTEGAAKPKGGFGSGGGPAE